MRQFDVDETTTLMDPSIASLAADCFGTPVDTVDTNEYVVDPDNPLATEIYIAVHPGEDTLTLDIETIDVDEAQRQHLVDRVEPLVQAKNEFLREATGKTVADRRQEMRQDVMPTEAPVVEIPDAH